jgi:hypothetical protein
LRLFRGYSVSSVFNFAALRLCVRFFGAAGNFRDLGAYAVNFLLFAAAF